MLEVLPLEQRLAYERENPLMEHAERITPRAIRAVRKALSRGDAKVKFRLCRSHQAARYAYNDITRWIGNDPDMEAYVSRRGRHWEVWVAAPQIAEIYAPHSPWWGRDEKKYNPRYRKHSTRYGASR